MELTLKTLMRAEIENAMLVPQDPELNFTPAVAPALYWYMLTPQGERDWAPILDAPVSRIAIETLECGKSGLVVELDTEDATMLMNFGNLLAGNCTQEQAQKWLSDPLIKGNGYEWDGPDENGMEKEVERAADYIVRQGLENTSEGSWTVSFAEVETATGLAVSEADGTAAMVLAALERREEVADIELAGDTFDACFYLDFCKNLELSDEEIGQVME